MRLIPGAYARTPARTFDATATQYFEAATGLGLGANDAFWVAAWVRRDGNQITLVSLGRTGGSTNDSRMVLQGTGTNIQAVHTNAGGGNSAATTTLTQTTAWRLVIAHFTQGSTARDIYVDNVGATNAGARTLTNPPNLLRVGLTMAGTNPAAMGLASLAIFGGVSTADLRAQLQLGAHPLTIAAPLLDAWTFATPGPQRGLRGTILQPVGGGAMSLGPVIQQLRRQPQGYGGLVGSGVVTLPTDAGSYSISGSDAGLVYSGSTASVVTLSRSIFRGVFPRVPGRVN